MNKINFNIGKKKKKVVGCWRPISTPQNRDNNKAKQA